MYEDNFNMDEIDFERGGAVQSRLPKQNEVKSSKIQSNSTGVPKQSSMSSYMSKPPQETVAGRGQAVINQNKPVARPIVGSGIAG